MDKRKGFYDNQGVCDVLLGYTNQLPKLLIDNQFIAFCDTISKMGQLITNLKKGIAEDLESKNEVIEELKRVLKNKDLEFVDIPVDQAIVNGKDGTANGDSN